jgi:glycosyltransferase involved in cell wall biosynthesis
MPIPLLTVVTPSYNRAKLLPRLYDSLEAQSCHDFIWLVVDDGSTDGTSNMFNVENGMFNGRRPTFKVQYVRKENGGKHTALNTAIDIVSTELLFIVDSDDVLTPDAIATIKEDWEKAQGSKLKVQCLCGISYLRGYSIDKPIGDIFPKDYFIDSFSNVRVNQHVTGDKAEVWATKYLKEFRFPVFKGERFLVESWMWEQVSDLADMLFVNKVIYLTQYLQGGLTQSGRKLRINNPHGGMVFCLLMMRKKYPMRDRLKNGLLYTAYSFFAHQNIIRTLNCKHPGLTAFCLPLGFMLYVYWNRKYNK